MTNLLRLFVGIVLLRGKPQDLPASPTLTYASALAAVLANYVVDWTHPDVAMRLLFALAQAGLFGLAIRIALRLRGLPERWNQAMTALYVSGSLIQIIGWPAYAWLEQTKNTPTDALQPLFLILVLGIWFLMVMAHVLRHALEVSFAMAALVSLACQMVTAVVLLTLFATIPA